MTATSRLAVGLTATATGLLLAYALVVGVLNEKLARDAGITHQQVLRWQSQKARWWAGALIITAATLTVACGALAVAEGLQGFRRSFAAGAVGALAPIFALMATTTWVGISYIRGPGESLLGCMLPARAIIIGPFLASLLVPGLFLQIVRRRQRGA